MATAVGATEKSNLGAVFKDCAESAGGSVRYIAPDPAKVEQGRIIRDDAAVKKAQEALGVKSDGMWGNKTTTAAQQRIEQFQKDNGLEVTGRYSAETAERMKANPASKNLAEALDGMRNRNILDRVYAPLQKENAADLDCRRPTAGASGSERAVGKTENSIGNSDRGIANRDARSIGNKENSIGNKENSIGNSDRGIANRDARSIVNKENSIGNKENSIGNADRSIANRDARSIGNKENSIGNRENSIGNADPPRSIVNRDNSIGNIKPDAGTTTFVQPVAVYAVGKDGSFKELSQGSLHNGKIYDPELGGLVTQKQNPSMDAKALISSMREGGLSMSNISATPATPDSAAPASLVKRDIVDTFKP